MVAPALRFSGPASCRPHDIITAARKLRENPERTRLRSPELTQRVRMGLCSGGRISRYLAYMKVSIPPSRPGFRKTLRQPAVESLPCPRLGPGMAAGTARRRAAHSVIEGRLTPFQA